MYYMPLNYTFKVANFMLCEFPCKKKKKKRRKGGRERERNSSAMVGPCFQAWLLGSGAAAQIEI